MDKKIAWYLMLILLIPFAGCEELECCIHPPSLSENVFAKPFVGNQSTYVRFSGEKYWDQERNDFKYLTDTIIVEILERNGNTFRMREKFTPGSYTLSRIRVGEFGLDSMYLYDWVRETDRWTFNSGNSDPYDVFPSQLFNMRLVDTFSLELEGTELKECKTNGNKVFDCYERGFIRNWQLGKRVYARVLVFFNQDEIIADGPSYVWIYSKAAGIPQTIAVNSWTQQWEGWEWIE